MCSALSDIEDGNLKLGILFYLLIIYKHSDGLFLDGTAVFIVVLVAVAFFGAFILYGVLFSRTILMMNPTMAGNQRCPRPAETPDTGDFPACHLCSKPGNPGYCFISKAFCIILLSTFTTKPPAVQAPAVHNPHYGQVLQHHSKHVYAKTTVTRSAH